MDIKAQREHSPLTLFYSYADQDEHLCEELEKHLSILQRQAIIAGWHHHKVLPGADKDQINDEQFSSAQIIILLISPDFLASDASHAEMERALQHHTAGLAFVIPLLLRPVDWQPAAFAHLQALPRNGMPVTMWENRDEAFADIAKDVRLAIEQWNGPALKPVRQSPTPVLPAPFFCSTRKDLPLLKRLEEELRAYGIMKEKDHHTPQSGSPDEDEKDDLRDEISSASAVILVASPSTRRSRSIKQALHIAEMYQRTLYLFWIQGNHLSEVMPTGYDHLPSIDARGERYPQALQDLAQALGRQTSLDSGSEQSVPLLEAPRNPYKGLQAFRMEDVQDFFGRDRLIEELLEKVQQLFVMDQQDQISSRLLTILGPSGSGKSSLVMAGLLPRLKQGGLPGSENWTYLSTMVPGQHPLEALALTLAPLFPEHSAIKLMREDLEDDSARGLHILLSMYAKSSDARVLLVIDQFEELFTQTVTEDERRHFLELLLTAVTEPNSPLITIITLRADFYDRPLQYPELGHIIENHHVTCYPLDMRDLRAAIEQPAQLSDVQLTFEEGLVGDLLFDVQGQVGALPLLQFTLDRLFQHRQERLLALHAYHQIGGIKGALARHAESTYQSLSTENLQRLVHALFLRLINPGTVGEDATRRRVPLSELVVIDQEKTARLAEVTNIFIKARLLTANTVGGVSTVEVSHEALIQAWIRLQDWLHDSRDDMRLQQAVSEDTVEWKRHGQLADQLYRGSQLAEALRWRAANLPSLDEDLFLQISIKEQLRFRRRTFLIGLIGVAGMTGTGFLVTKLFPHDSPSYTYTKHTSLVDSVAWSPDGQRLASASFDNTVQVWDPSNGNRQLTYTKHTSFVLSVAWSPDGKRIASASNDKTVHVWDASSGNRQFTYTGHTDAVNSVAWSPDGKRLASASDDETVQVWDASSGNRQMTYTKHTGFVFSVAWSPDGKRLASASTDTTAQVWDASSGNRQVTYTGHTDFVNSVAWSPDGKRLSSASNDKTVQVWDASSGNRQFTRTGHTATVRSVAWSPDGKRIASAGDKIVLVCDAASGDRQQFAYIGHTSDVFSVAWSPDGKRLASASADETVRVCDASSGSQFIQPLIYTGHTSFVNSVAWSPDGKRLASASDDKTVQVWDASSGRRQFTYTGHTDYADSVAWSPDGKRLASASTDKTVQVWDASSGRWQFTYTGHTDIVFGVAWSPDSKRLASASFDKTVQIWDASSGSRQFTYTGHTDFVDSVAWSPDGKRLASASTDKTVQVWDANSGSRQFTYTGHTEDVYAVAWSPDGKRLASASGDKTVQVWDANSGSWQFTYTGHTEKVFSVAWSPDGKRIASAGGDTFVQVWDANSGNQQFTYTGHSFGVSDVAWSPDGKRIASADDETVQVWDVSNR